MYSSMPSKNCKNLLPKVNSFPRQPGKSMNYIFNLSSMHILWVHQHTSTEQLSAALTGSVSGNSDIKIEQDRGDPNPGRRRENTKENLGNMQGIRNRTYSGRVDNNTFRKAYLGKNVLKTEIF